MNNPRFFRLWNLVQIAPVLLAIFLVNFTVQIGVEPGYKNMATDSGIFAYCGQEITRGSLLYRDCWDHKPPAVYYLNAAAILLGGARLWAIWLFQAIWVTLAAAAFYLIVRKVWGGPAAIAVAAVFLLTLLYPGYYQGGNLTETYALLPLALTIGALYGYLSSKKNFYLLSIGVLTAFAFLLKPTYISMGVAAGLIILYLDARRYDFGRMFINLALLSASALIPLALVASYWIIKGSFYELWFAVWTYNRQYVQDGFSLLSLYTTARILLVNQPLASVFILAVISYLTYLAENRRKLVSSAKGNENGVECFTPGKLGQENARLWLMATLGISLILDIGLVSISGKNYGHYFLIPLPAMSASIAYLLSFIGRGLQHKAGTPSTYIMASTAILLLVMAWGLEIAGKEKPDLAELVYFFTQPDITSNHPNELEQHIINNSEPSDSVLVWGHAPRMNFITGRRSPTRFIFTPHIFTPTTKGSHGFDEFLSELERDPPAMVVALQYDKFTLPFFGNADEVLCRDCGVSLRQGVLDVKRYIESRYEIDAYIDDWVVYRKVVTN